MYPGDSVNLAGINWLKVKIKSFKKKKKDNITSNLSQLNFYLFTIFETFQS